MSRNPAFALALLAADAASAHRGRVAHVAGHTRWSGRETDVTAVLAGRLLARRARGPRAA